MTYTLIALGSNLGDREAMIVEAVARLKRVPELHFIALSPLYESPAWLPAGAPREWNMPYLNAVAAFDTALMAHSVLELTQHIEAAMGRRTKGDGAPRPIDLDLLAYGTDVLEGETLCLPHPRLHQRDFVLLPLADIAPDWRYRGQTVRELIAALPEVTARRY